MPTVREIAKMDTDNIFALEDMREQLGVTKSMFSKLANIHQSTYYRIIRENDLETLKKYEDQFVNVLASIQNIKNGVELAPKNGYDSTKNNKLIKLIDRLKKEDVDRIEQIREELGITQGFLGECAGTTAGNYHQMAKQAKKITGDYIHSIKNTLRSIALLQLGYKAIPVDTRNGKKKGSDEAKEADTVEIPEPNVNGIDKNATVESTDNLEKFLQDVMDPKFRALHFTDVETNMYLLLKEFSERAEKLYSRLYTEE